MALLSPRPGDFVFETTSTAGTFNTFTLSGTRVSDPTTGFAYDLFSDYFADGELVYYIRTQTVSVGVRAIKEAAIGIYHRGANSIEPTIGLWSTNMAAGSSTWVPITWAAGSQNVTCGVPGADVVTIRLIAQVLALAAAANRTALGLGTSSVFDVGTTANKILQLDSSAKIPPVDGSQITGLPAPQIPTGGVFKVAVYSNAATFTGWTRIVSIDDCVMALTNNTGVTGGGPHAGGTTGGIGWDVSFGLTIANHTLTVSEIPNTSTAGPGFGISAVDPANTPAGHSHGINNAQTWRPLTAYFSLYSRD